MNASWRSTTPASTRSSTILRHWCPFQPMPQSSIHWLQSMLWPLIARRTGVRKRTLRRRLSAVGGPKAAPGQPRHPHGEHPVPLILQVRSQTGALTTMPATSDHQEVRSCPTALPAAPNWNRPSALSTPSTSRPSTTSAARTTAAAISSGLPWPAASSPRSGPAPDRLLG